MEMVVVDSEDGEWLTDGDGGGWLTDGDGGGGRWTVEMEMEMGGGGRYRKMQTPHTTPKSSQFTTKIMVPPSTQQSLRHHATTANASSLSA
ncbi:hypothetical protein Q3G72_012830 [Acer saccharum]|nr:hypothetical protein Q3G72_012830 [Acer saccharum]